MESQFVFLIIGSFFAFIWFRLETIIWRNHTSRLGRSTWYSWSVRYDAIFFIITTSICNSRIVSNLIWYDINSSIRQDLRLAIRDMMTCESSSSSSGSSIVSFSDSSSSTKNMTDVSYVVVVSSLRISSSCESKRRIIEDESSEILSYFSKNIIMIVSEIISEMIRHLKLLM